MPKQRKCKYCDGTGDSNGNHERNWVKCEYCKGWGWVPGDWGEHIVNWDKEAITLGLLCARCFTALGNSYWSEVPGLGYLCMDCHDRWTEEE